MKLDVCALWRVSQKVIMWSWCILSFRFFISRKINEKQIVAWNKSKNNFISVNKLISLREKVVIFLLQIIPKMQTQPTLKLVWDGNNDGQTWLLQNCMAKLWAYKMHIMRWQNILYYFYNYFVNLFSVKKNCKQITK